MNLSNWKQNTSQGVKQPFSDFLNASLDIMNEIDEAKTEEQLNTSYTKLDELLISDEGELPVTRAELATAIINLLSIVKLEDLEEETTHG